MDVRGDMIRQLRMQRGWTQQQLAEIADLSLRTVQRVENQNVASNESVSSLAAVLELPREQILATVISSDQISSAQRQVAWLLPAATVAGAIIGSAGTFLVMNWLGG
ncbi:MAG: helix-turn-helix domain-containing protein [Wenzhouxiangella sp.]|nr:helix-turn-helix domain-containing protein [Wenzhouxiangella sp.]TVR94761.1 MAG: XRE family transcriptional regulator [Wenzhouxiangellaceae bacterium]